jgi:hypothetical protein
MVGEEEDDDAEEVLEVVRIGAGRWIDGEVGICGVTFKWLKNYSSEIEDFRSPDSDWENDRSVSILCLFFVSSCLVRYSVRR